MVCPRCGLENLTTAEHCARCGTPLVDFSADRPWGLPGIASGALGGGNMDAGYPAPRQPDESASSWLASALRGGPADAAQETPVSGSTLPPWLSQPNAERSRGRAEEAQGWPGISSGALPPANPPDFLDSLISRGLQSGLQSNPNAQASSFPSAGRGTRPGESFGGIGSDASLGRRTLAPGLGPGASLRDGRYRLLQPFQAAPQLRAQGGEPPLMIAQDGNLAGGRVLLQELPSQHTLTDGGEQVRRLVANRMQAVAESGVTPKVVDQFTENGRHFLVFELPTGDPLLDRMHRARGPIDETSAIRYALQIVDALAVLERQQPPVIHGNLSPANVVLRPSGSAMLVGQSSVLMLPPSIAGSYSVAGGVPGYAAPEQARGTATTRSDLYAVCAILQHAVTGVTPPPRANWMYPPARRQNPNVSLELEEVLGRGLRPSATQRFGSAQELRDALLPLAAGQRTLVPDDLRDAPAPPPLTPVRNARGQLRLPGRRADSRRIVMVAIVLLLVLGLGVGAFYTTMPRPSGSGASSNPTPNQIAADYQARGIGISAGELIFDQQLPDNDAKQTGARAVAANNFPAALAAYKQAITEDPGDAEAAIYAENLRILVAQEPYVTLVAGIALGAADDASRSELQGVFLLQQMVNQSNLLPSGVQLRVEIANSGATLADVTVVSKFLLNILQEGNVQHFVGLVGWPQADETQLAVTALKQTNLALVSPTVSPDELSGLGSNYFSVVPADSVQGSELADAAVTQFGAQRVLLLTDATSLASVHTSQGFQKEFQSKYAATGASLDTTDYTSGSQGSFENVLTLANSQHDDLLFVACGDNCDTSIASLARAVSEQSWPSGTPPNILVDSHGFTPALVGLGTTTVAQLVQGNPAIFKHYNVYVTALTDDDVWNDQTDLGASIEYDQPNLPSSYSAQFDPNNSDLSGLAEPNAATILSYDAAHILISASRPTVQVKNGAVRPITVAQVGTNILKFTSAHPFMGVSGVIAYGSNGGMGAKALIIEQLVPSVGAVASNSPVALPTFQGVGYLVGGKTDFCGSVPSCKPS